MKNSKSASRSLNTNKGYSMKKSTLVINDLKDNAPKASSLSTQLSKADLYAEGMSAEEGESHKLLGISTQMIDDVERFEEYERKAKGFNNRRAMVEAWFNANPEYKPAGTWDYTNEEHVEILALYVESMKEDGATSTGNNYVRNEGVTVILQGFSEKSGRWFTLTKSYEDKTKIIFNYDVETLCNFKQSFAFGLKNTTVRQARFDLESKQTTYVNNSTTVIAADMMKQGYFIDGKAFRVVLISNAFNYWMGEVDSYKMVKESEKVTVVMANGTEKEMSLSNPDAKWVREDNIWSMGEEVAPGVIVLPATTDTLAAVMELKQMESDIQIGASALTSNAATTLADKDEHMAIVSEQDYIAYLEARAKIKVATKAIKVNNVLIDNADAVSIIEAVYFTSQAEGDAAAIGILEQYEHMANDLWKVFFAFKSQTGNQFSWAVFNKLKTMNADAKLAKMETALREKCTDEVKGMILRINAGEKFEMTGAEALAVFEAACAGERITDVNMFKAIKIAAIAHREKFSA